VTEFAKFSNLFSDGAAFLQSRNDENSSPDGYVIIGSDGFSAQTNYYDYTSDSLSFFVVAPFTGKKVFWFNTNGTSGLGIGFMSGTTPVLNPGASLGSTYGCFFTNQLGNVICNGSIPFTIPGGLSSFGFYVDTVAGTAYITPDGVNFYGNSGIALTAEQAEAGVNPFDLTAAGLTGPYLPFVVSNQGAVLLNSGQSPYPGTTLTGYNNLTPTLTTNLQPAMSGGDVSVTWNNTNNLDGELQWTITPDDDGSWVNCGGVSTGAGGVATCGTAETIPDGTADLSVIYFFRDGGNVYNCSPFQYLPVIARQDGDGDVIASFSFSFLGGVQPSTLIPFIGGNYSKVFVSLFAKVGNTNGITASFLDPTALPVWGVYWNFPGTEPNIAFQQLNGTDPTSGPDHSGTPDVGVAYAFGVLDATDRAEGTIELYHGNPPPSETTYGPTPWPGTSDTPFSALLITDSTSGFAFGYTAAVVVRAPYVPPYVPTALLTQQIQM